MAKLNGRQVFTACIEHIAVGSLSFIEQFKIDLGAFIPKPNEIAWSDPGSSTRLKVLTTLIRFLYSYRVNKSDSGPSSQGAQLFTDTADSPKISFISPCLVSLPL